MNNSPFDGLLPLAGGGGCVLYYRCIVTLPKEGVD